MRGLVRKSEFQNALKHHIRYKSSKTEPSSGVFNSAAEFLGNLRWRAANALASTLSTEERDMMLRRFAMPREEIKQKHNENDINNEVDGGNDLEQTSKPSIAEAVAAARAEEAAKLEHIWAQEKEKIQAEAQLAAQARVESDLVLQRRKLAFDAWKKDLERSQDKLTTTKNAQEQVQKQEINEDKHPILGKILVDLGHKRLYLASATALAAIPVWKKQRIYRHGRAKEMAKDKMKSLDLGFPGAICLYEASDGSLSILDGQHRVGMMSLLQKNEKAQQLLDFDQILVEVYPEIPSIKSHAQDLFTEINKAEPVKLVDLPGFAKKSHLKIINEGAARLHNKYSNMFSASQRCRPPHLNIDNLREALNASEVIVKFSLKNPTDLVEWMMQQNKKLATKYSLEEHASSVSPAALKKAVDNNFYLGLDSSWLLQTK